MSTEQYITITDLMADQKIYINNKEYTADESGVIILSGSMLVSGKGTPIERYESYVNTQLNDIQKMYFYGMLGRGSFVVTNSIVKAIDGDRALAKEIMTEGEKCGVLTRSHNYSWKVVSKHMKEQMLAWEARIATQLDIIKNENESGEDFKKSVLNEYQKSVINVKEKKEIREKDTSNSNIKQFQSSLPSPSTKKTQSIKKKSVGTATSKKAT